MAKKTRSMDLALLRQIEIDYLDWRILLVKARNEDVISQALIDMEMSDKAFIRLFSPLMVLLKTLYHTDKNAFIRYEVEFHRLIGRALSAHGMEIITNDKQFTPLRKNDKPAHRGTLPQPRDVTLKNFKKIKVMFVHHLFNCEDGKRRMYCVSVRTFFYEWDTKLTVSGRIN